MKLSSLAKLFPIFFVSAISLMILKVGKFPSVAIAENLNPSLLTRQHISIYKDMEKHAEHLENEKKALDNKQQLVSEQEERVQSKLLELKKLSTWLNHILNSMEEGYEQNIAKLIKSLETMKAEEAGKIMKGLTIDTLFFIAKKMKAQKLSAILPHLEKSQTQTLLQFSISQVQAIKKAPTKLPLNE